VSIKQTTVFECDACTKTKNDPSYDEKNNWWKLENSGSSYDKPTRLLCTECKDLIFATIDELKSKFNDKPKDNTVHLGAYR
jgi:hypothetical protein